jgi:hypothetical protein
MSLVPMFWKPKPFNKNKGPFLKNENGGLNFDLPKL